MVVLNNNVVYSNIVQLHSERFYVSVASDEIALNLIIIIIDMLC